QMKSVGEVMSIGRNFQESLQKGLRGLETGSTGLDEKIPDFSTEGAVEKLRKELSVPGPERIWYVADAFRYGMSVMDVYGLTFIDPWFLAYIQDLVQEEGQLKGAGIDGLDEIHWRRIKRKGFGDTRLSKLLGVDEDAVRARRWQMNVRPVYKRVDTCAAEFATSTAYMYSTYDEECEADTSDREKIMILGGGPNRIGQGIEFDYCCVHAALALREEGFETIMVNCNPETVSTDFDTSDRLYFESLTLEDVIEIVELEKPKGVIVQYGGQTPLKLARALESAGAPIIGTSPDSIDLAEDRERFQKLINDLGLLQPPNRTARNLDDAISKAEEVGYPLVVRPSYVLGGRGMEVVFSEDELREYMLRATEVSEDYPLLLDRFLDQAVEVDVDIIHDGKETLIGGIMEHIEQAGVHSGDSSCSLPPATLTPEVQDELKAQVRALADGLNVLGLMNTQFAIQKNDIYILEVNPRASRTVPFVSKAIGKPLAKIAAKCMSGVGLKQQGVGKEVDPTYYSVKESVFPFIKFPEADAILGPEMKSTGEVMGVGRSFGEAYAKAQLASNVILPSSGRVLVTVADRDKPEAVLLCRQLLSRGFGIIATRGTASALCQAGVPCETVNKVREGRPHIVDLIKNEEINMIVNTTEGKRAIRESHGIRREAVRRKITYYTTVAGAKATCMAIDHLNDADVNRLQDLHQELLP
ncbi:MAG: carbamoyl-phosphate synthase large subunit, partial [Pseudomonadota bacterium]